MPKKAKGSAIKAWKNGGRPKTGDLTAAKRAAFKTFDAVKVALKQAVTDTKDAMDVANLWYKNCFVKKGKN